ncbi:hypothetical protein PCIT_a1316 [Pseudoalteromonas citrea]|uniref:DUF1330 domain-containing protein n=2 Tax=Pseudoalteromonas citrea TaxID=43655 RepID=A0AAD4FTM9_9GAMM|nr:DUF1330 domain-containing protein [Pseudoalteromonas citrea]KAF7775185.1 hypothetical protein PCIT_a1316 [Pseudoalteromonas citrea]
MAFVIVESNVKNQELLQQYGQQAGKTVAKFGGKFIAKGPAESLHGKSRFANRAVIEFSSVAQAQSWYNSDEYQVLIELRERAIESRFVVINSI